MLSTWVFVCLFSGCTVFIAAHELSLVAVSRDSSLVAVCGLLITAASLVLEHWLSQ